ncbi:autophagy protein atg9 [Agyrium rufum]|nr:autophagy protein atg9 [Agyrium rufum]
MASNFFSRVLSPNTASPSIYETLRAKSNPYDTDDVENQAGLNENDGSSQGDHAHDLGASLEDAMGQDLLVEAPPMQEDDIILDRKRSGGIRDRNHQQSRQAGAVNELEDLHDEVPLSLLIEDRDQEVPVVRPQGAVQTQHAASAGPQRSRSTGSDRARWQTTQQQQMLYDNSAPKPDRAIRSRPANLNLAVVDPKEKALWRWANVENLDNFLREVYDYYQGKGIWSILLANVLRLLTLLFVVGFGTFLTSCVDYRLVPVSKTMSQILIPRCTKNMSGLSNLLIWLFSFYWIFIFFHIIRGIPRLKAMHDFFHYLLEISDSDIQTVSWQDVVKRLMALRDANLSTAVTAPEKHKHLMGTQSKQRMDAHDIANRIMRRDNFLVALINKEVMDISIPVPFIGKRKFFSRALRWNLEACILDLVFDRSGQVLPEFLKDRNRRALSEQLRKRFLWYGILTLVTAPFALAFITAYYFFRYFTEFQRNPSRIGSRAYTPLAEWKFREFNELEHLFDRRLNMSYPFASRYVDQFPKDKTVQLSRFVAFVVGAVASVLAAATLIDPESFLSFEVTHERTVLFYLGVLGAVWAAARGVVPEENHVFDPKFALNNVIEYTHYLPSHWRGRLHSDEVRKDFARLYQMKIVIFFEEMLGIIITPIILWYSLPKCSDRIVDFFREFTVHIDGLGHVCSFAVFDFQRGGNCVKPQLDKGKGDGLRDEFYSTKDNKMLASYYGFIDNYVTNPKTGIQFQQPRRPFHPPPTFPPAMSPLSPGPMPEASQLRNGSYYGQHKQGKPSSARTPRFAPMNFQSSPITSILLDPPHQPSLPLPPSAMRNSKQARNLSGSRKPQRLATNIVEDEEEQSSPVHEVPNLDGGTPGAMNSNIGESWKTTRAGMMDDDENSDGGEQTGADVRGQGVLGMVYQFSKAQTEGKIRGVNI